MRGGLGFHGPPHPGQRVVPPGGVLAGGGAGLVVFADGVLPGGAGLQPREPQILGDERRCPAGLPLVHRAAAPQLAVIEPAQVDALGPAERGERGVPVGAGLR